MTGQPSPQVITASLNMVAVSGEFLGHALRLVDGRTEARHQRAELGDLTFTERGDLFRRQRVR